MKTLSKIITLSALATVAVQAQSSTYLVTGTMDAVNVDVSPAPTVITIIDRYDETQASGPQTPSLTGSWDLDASAASFTSGDLNVDEYVNASNAFGGFYLSDIVRQNDIFNINSGGTANWDAGTLTLTYSVGSGTIDSNDGASYSGANLDVSNTLNGSIDHNYDCSGAAIVCNAVAAGDGSTSAADMAVFSLVFTDVSLSEFNGTVTLFAKGANLETNTVYSINGVSEVPVPAAAWLFGSALVGLAGVARKRSITV